MSKPFTPFDYQEQMIQWLIDHEEAALFCSPGLGKTGVTLFAWNHFARDDASRGLLIVAPIRVCNITWPAEIAKWGFSDWMTVANLRTAEGIKQWEKGTADVYLINSEMLATREVQKDCKSCLDGKRWTLTHPLEDTIELVAVTPILAEVIANKKCPDWREEGYTLRNLRRQDCDECMGEGQTKVTYPGFVSKYIKGRKKLPVDILVVDELSLAKSAKSKRFNALRAWREKFKRVWGLTGTPAPNSYLDLWAQCRFLDDGDRLGVSQEGYKRRYFMTNGPSQFAKYSLKPGAKEEIEDKISDLALTMLSEDYLDVPTCNFEDVEVTLNSKSRKEYETMKKELLLSIESGEIEALNAAALTNKLLQITGGAVYDADKEVHILHDAKITALQKLIKAHKGEPILVLTQFKHERKRLIEALPGAKLFHEKGLPDWKVGKIPVWIADPRSMSHGIDGMQHGGRIAVWFTLTYSNETYIQTNARLVRTGQSNETIVYRLIATGTVDEAVVEALREKDDQQNGLFTALRNLQMMETTSKKKSAK